MTRRELFGALTAAITLPFVAKATEFVQSPFRGQKVEPRAWDAQADAYNTFEALKLLRKNYKDGVGREPDFYLTNWRGIHGYYRACITECQQVNNLLMANQLRGLDYAGAPLTDKLPRELRETEHYRVRSSVYVSDGENRWHYYACELLD
jgi:hypothetical protein